MGSEGVVFRCLTVNVKNEDDEALLGFLEPDVFTAGLMLATTARASDRPAIMDGIHPHQEHCKAAQERVGTGFLHGARFHKDRVPRPSG